MSFLSELRRRNVIRVAIAYAVAAWLLIQIAATTFPVLRLPDWSTPLVTVLILIGFPLALIFAWAFELTPQGIKLDKDVEQSESIRKLTGRKLDFIIIGILVMAVVYFAIDDVIFDSAKNEAQSPEAIATETAADSDRWTNSIAVLPFVNMSGDPDNEYFSDGISEEILNLLARIPDLKVIGRTSSFSFKRKNQDLRDIGRALGVKTLLEGSVRRSGNQVRITAQLIDASDGSHIWSEIYERTMTDIFAVQDDVAGAITDELHVHVGLAPGRGVPTVNPQAYALFLKAKAAISASENFAAERFLQQATTLDPNYAEAYEMAAFNYWLMAGSALDADSAREQVRDNAARAIELDDSLMFANVYASTANLGPDYRSGTVAALDQALRDHPDDPQLLEAQSWLLVEMGYLNESLRLTQRYLQVDPLSIIANAYYAASLYSVGRNDEAMIAAEFVLQSKAAINDHTWSVVGMLLAENRSDVAIRYVESFLQAQAYPDTGWFRDLVMNGRDRKTGQLFLDRRIPEVLAAMPKQSLVNWEEELLSLYLFFGFIDRYHEAVLETNPTDQTWHFAGIHAQRGVIFRQHGYTAHPDFMVLADLLGIDDVWEHRGPPDFCQRSDGRWACK